MEQQLYNIGTSLYHLSVRMAAPLNEKAGRRTEGLRQWRQDLRRQCNGFGPGKTLWMHCASAGEFEQGRPILQALRSEFPRLNVLLTFYSPSGYGLRKNTPLADAVAYLPPDTASNAADFLNIVQPDAAIFVKYEFWLHYLQALEGKGVPNYLVSAVFRPGQVFFKPWGGLFRKALGSFGRIFVQDENSRTLLQNIGIGQVEVAGDTRADRVWQLAQNAPDLPFLQQFKGKGRLLVAGSTWRKDGDLLLAFINRRCPDDVKLLLAPHEINSDAIEAFRAKLAHPSLRHSQLVRGNDARLPSAKVLVLDNVGMLASAYKHGDFAYVGGGFGKGIHNILEPAAFGLPVIFGPRFGKFREARILVAHQGAFPVSDPGEFGKVFDRLHGNRNFCRKAAAACKNHVESETGGTESIMKHLRKTLKVSAALP